MSRAVEALPAVTGLTVAFPLRMPAGGVVQTGDAAQLQRAALAPAVGQQVA